MDRRSFTRRISTGIGFATAGLGFNAAADTQVPILRGTGDLGIVIERVKGSILVVDTTAVTILGRVEGLGDLSHASAVFSRDGRFAYIFGRDGGLTKIDLLTQTLVKRIVQSGNAIGGAISQDGRFVAAQNYTPGGVRVFDAATLELVADVPTGAKVVGLADVPRKGFIFSLFEAGEIWLIDMTNAVRITRFSHAGKQPYDGLITPDGRYYIAGLFGEDGLAQIDLWQPEKGVKKILSGYGRGEEPLPVFKMPHLRGWAMAGGYLYLPAIGRHEVLVVDTRTWEQIARIPVKGQPVFVIAQPDGREVWVNFAHPDNHYVQIIDTLIHSVVAELEPGKVVLHMEFAPRGEVVWISTRDDNKVTVIDTRTRRTLATLTAQAPSGIFFTARAGRIGF